MNEVIDVHRRRRTAGGHWYAVFWVTGGPTTFLARFDRNLIQ
jgi:hypothetical protein